MRSKISSRASALSLAVVVSALVMIASASTVSAKRPPKPPPTPAPTAAPTTPPSASVSIQIAASGTLEPNRQYAVVAVTVTCPTGWTWTRGSLYLRQSNPGGSGSFTASCTGAPQTVQSRVVNGNTWTLGNALATAYVTIARNGQELTTSTERTIRLDPGVTVRVADQGQLTGSSGSGVRLAVAVACPSGATGQASSVSVSQGGTQGSGSFIPTCDGQSHTFVVSIAASPFQTGSATGAATASVGFGGGTFQGADSRAITILESSTGDATKPTTPGNLSANVFSDGETWLSWTASTDNATPTGLITYEVYLNGRLDQPVGGGYTQAILYADHGVVNTIEVIAVDGAGNRSAPATVTVDCSFGFGCQ